MNTRKTFKNKWLDNEVRSLETELQCGKQPDVMFYKLLAMSLLLLFLSIKAFGDISFIDSCPYCHKNIEISIDPSQTAGFFPDTWQCKNEKCGYVNYEGINSCALCGKKRQ